MKIGFLLGLTAGIFMAFTAIIIGSSDTPSSLLHILLPGWKQITLSALIAALLTITSFRLRGYELAVGDIRNFAKSVITWFILPSGTLAGLAAVALPYTLLTGSSIAFATVIIASTLSVYFAWLAYTLEELTKPFLEMY